MTVDLAAACRLLFAARADAIMIVAAGISLCCLTTQVWGQSESQMRERLCAGMVQEWHLREGARVDCQSATHPIEVDFSEKWAEAIGQTLLPWRNFVQLPAHQFLPLRDQSNRNDNAVGEVHTAAWS